MGLIRTKRFLALPALIATCFVASCFLYPSSLAKSYNYQDNEDGVIYPSGYYEKRNKHRNAEYRDPNARKIRYKPVANNPKLDPLDDSYGEWLDEVRDRAMIQSEIDDGYEDFVKEISPLIFSLGHNELEPELKELIAGIPANALKPVGSQFLPDGPIDIDRKAPSADPFSTATPAEEEVLGADVGLDIAVDEPQGQADSLLSMAYDALKMGQLEGAAELYTQALVAEPDNKQAMFGLATAYHRAGQFDQAREQYIEILSEDPNDWPALNNLMILAGEESPEDALKELKELELINPEFGPIPAQLGMIYLRLNNPDEAIKYLTRAILLEPENLAYRYNLAIVLDHGGHKKQAVRLYQQLLNAEKQGHKLPESPDRIRDRLAFISSSPLLVR